MPVMSRDCQAWRRAAGARNNGFPAPAAARRGSARCRWSGRTQLRRNTPLGERVRVRAKMNHGTAIRRPKVPQVQCEIDRRATVNEVATATGVIGAAVPVMGRAAMQLARRFRARLVVRRWIDKAQLGMGVAADQRQRHHNDETAEPKHAHSRQRRVIRADAVCSSSSTDCATSERLPCEGSRSSERLLIDLSRSAR